MSHLVNCQVNAGIGDDSKQIWYISSVKTFHPLFGVYLHCCICNTFILSSLPQRQSRFQHLE